MPERRSLDEYCLHRFTGDAAHCIAVVDCFAVVAVPQHHRCATRCWTRWTRHLPITFDHHDRVGEGVSKRLALHIPRGAEPANSKSEAVDDMEDEPQKGWANANRHPGRFADAANPNLAHAPRLPGPADLNREQNPRRQAAEHIDDQGDDEESHPSTAFQ